MWPFRRKPMSAPQPRVMSLEESIRRYADGLIERFQRELRRKLTDEEKTSIRSIRQGQMLEVIERAMEGASETDLERQLQEVVRMTSPSN